MQILISILILDVILDLMHEKPFHCQMLDCSGLCKNKIIFGIDSNSSVYSDNKGPADGLDDTAITAEAEFFVNFGEQQEKFCLSLYHNGSSSYLFVNRVRVYQFKVKYSETKPNVLCISNIWNYFTVDDMKKTCFYGYVYGFSIEQDNVYISDVTQLLHKHSQIFYTISYKWMDSLSKRLLFWCLNCFWSFGVSLTAAKAIKWLSMNNQVGSVGLILVDLNLDELHYYQFIISMNLWDGRFNAVEDQFVRIYIPNKV